MTGYENYDKDEKETILIPIRRTLANISGILMIRNIYIMIL